MTEINFRNNNEYFQQLVAEAKKRAQDGKLTAQEIDELGDIARKSGNTFTNQERYFVENLDEAENVKTLNSDNFNSTDFKMEVNNMYLLGVGRDNWNDTASKNNPVGGKLDDYGSKKLNNQMQDAMFVSIFEPEVLPEEINTLKTDLMAPMSAEVKKSFENFFINFEKLGTREKRDTYEALLYVKELVKREPPLPANEQQELFNKLTGMLYKDYDHRTGPAKELVLSALHDIALPQNIAQRSIGTCAATSVEIQLAIREPKMYLDMLESLALNKAYQPPLPGSDKIKPNWTFDKEITEIEGKPTNRTISAMIMQNAIMDFADGDRREFDSSKGHGGLFNHESRKALQNLFGKPLQIYENHDFTPQQLMQILTDAKPSNLNPVQISMVFSREGRDGFHAVNVVDVNAQEVTIINPWGRKETFSPAKLQERIYGIIAAPGADSAITRTSVSGKNNAELISQIDKQGAKFLDKLTLKQKTDILKNLYNEDTNGNNQKAMTAIMEHIYQGSAGQDRQAFFDLSKSLKNEGLSLTKVLSKINDHSDRFYNLAQQVFEADKKLKNADFLLENNSPTKRLFINMNTKQKVAFVEALKDKGSHLSNKNPEITAHLLMSLVDQINSSEQYSDDYVKYTKVLQEFMKGLDDGNVSAVFAAIDRKDGNYLTRIHELKKEDFTALDEVDEFFKDLKSR